MSTDRRGLLVILKFPPMKNTGIMTGSILSLEKFMSNIKFKVLLNIVLGIISKHLRWDNIQFMDTTRQIIFKINKHVKIIMKVLVLKWSLNRRHLEYV
jgi:hypothetical protein